MWQENVKKPETEYWILDIRYWILDIGCWWEKKSNLNSKIKNRLTGLNGEPAMAIAVNKINDKTQ